jgi:hypothetical protein
VRMESDGRRQKASFMDVNTSARTFDCACPVALSPRDAV